MVMGMPTHREEQSNEVVRSIIEMLAEKFSEEKFVTVQRIFDKFATRLVKGRDITMYLFNIGILEPRREEETPKEANLWRINIVKVREFLESDGGLLDYKCPLCGSVTISKSYNSYRCTKCLFKGDLPEKPYQKIRKK
jgi:tRNA(Ile2) C34 agmatinyltransferase TiaS